MVSWTRYQTKLLFFIVKINQVPEEDGAQAHMECLLITKVSPGFPPPLGIGRMSLELDTKLSLCVSWLEPGTGRRWCASPRERTWSA